MHIGRWTLPAVLLGRGNLHVGTTHHAGHPKNRRHRPMQHQPRSSKSTTRWPAGPSAEACRLEATSIRSPSIVLRVTAIHLHQQAKSGQPLRTPSPLACSVLLRRRAGRRTQSQRPIRHERGGPPFTEQAGRGHGTSSSAVLLRRPMASKRPGFGGLLVTSMTEGCCTEARAFGLRLSGTKAVPTRSDGPCQDRPMPQGGEIASNG